MAELVGRAEIRVDANTAAALRSLRQLAASGSGPLRTLQRRISDVRGELRQLRGATVAVTVDDRTGPGVTAVRAAVRDLEGLGPIRIGVQVDGQTAEITRAARAMRDLRNDATGTSRALGVLTLRATASAAALRELKDAAQAAGRAVGSLARRAVAAAASLGALDDDTRTLRRDMDDLGDSMLRTGDNMGGLRGRLGALTTAAGDAAAAVGRGGAGGPGAGVAIGVAGTAAVTALPALGALVPMMVGLGAAGGVLALAFDDVKKEAGRLKPEFTELRKVASQAVMPGVKSFFTDLKGAMVGLHPAVRAAGQAMSGFARDAGQFAKSEAFQSSFTANVRLGSKWFREFGQSVLTVTQSLLDFGAKSKPTLDALGGGFNDLLSIGLPGFFKGLERGIQGSADMFTGLFDAVNKVLPAFGELVGEVANAVGPALREHLEFAGTTAAGAFRALGQAVRFMKPLFGEVGAVVRVAATSLRIAAGTAKNVAVVLLESLWPGFRKAEDAVGPLQRFAQWLKNNEVAVQEFTRKAAAGIIGFVSVTVSALPEVIAAFRLMSAGVFLAMGTIVVGASKAFGWIPGIGEKLRTAERDFEGFREVFMGGLVKAEQGARDFAEKVGPRLADNKLKMDIGSWEKQLAAAKKQLEDPKLTDPERTKLRATIKDLEKKIASGKRQLADRRLTDPQATKIRATIKDLTSKIATGKRRLRDPKLTDPERSKLRADIRDLQQKAGRARLELARVRGKTVTIRANYVQSGAVGAVAGLAGGRAQGGLIAYAGGGPILGFPHGGRVRGPGSGTSDSVPILASNGEFMIRAAAVRKYGTALFEQLNAMQVQRFSSRSRGRSGVPDLNVGTARARPSGVRPVDSGKAPTIVNNFHGPIGSQRELENWLAGALDKLNRTGRLSSRRR